MKLKILTGYVMAATLGAMFALPAFAQNVNPGAEAKLQNWMAKDPRLEADPGLMNNPTYLRNHPNFALWLQQHPNAHRQVEQMGAYDNNHQWRSTDWWHQNNPNWISQNHPEWNHNHPEWASNPTGWSNHPGGPGEGDWDEHHVWHDRGWWGANRRDWVAQHHPEWAAHHEAAVEHHEERVEHHEERVEHREEAVHNYEEHHEHH
jgi:hypothetical protein